MKVLLTGATGFIGRVTVAELRRRGVDVHAVVRASSDTSGLDATLHVADLCDAAALAPLVEGADAVVHAAGGGRALDLDHLWRSNTTSTESLVAACREARCPPGRFVLVSSVAARGPVGGRGPVTQYGRSKRAAEAALCHLPLGTASTVIRPPGVVGPGDDRMLSLFRAAAAGVTPFPVGQRAASFVYVDCVARAIADAALLPHPSGRTYYPADGQAWSPEAIAGAIGDAVGRRPAVVRVPRSALRAAAVLVEEFARRTGRPVFLTRDKARELTQSDWSCDPSSLTRDLGWRPSVDLTEGARRTAAALVRTGQLRPAKGVSAAGA